MKIDQFKADTAAEHAARLLTWRFEPNFGHASEENPDDISHRRVVRGEGIVNAVMHQSGTGPRPVLVWTYDEHGGYYDHVPPPPAVVPDDVPAA